MVNSLGAGPRGQQLGRARVDKRSVDQAEVRGDDNKAKVTKVFQTLIFRNI